MCVLSTTVTGLLNAQLRVSWRDEFFPNSLTSSQIFHIVRTLGAHDNLTGAGGSILLN